MMSLVVFVLSVLQYSQAADYPSQQWHPFLQMFYKPSSYSQPIHNGPLDRSADFFANPSAQEDSYFPANYRPTYPKPVYGPPERSDFFTGFSGGQKDFSGGSSLFTPNPTYGSADQNRFYHQNLAGQGDVSKVQNYDSSAFSSQPFYSTPERNDLSSQYSSYGQPPQSGLQIYDRPSISSGSFYGSPNRYHHGPSPPRPPRPSYGSPDRDTFNRPGGSSGGFRGSNPMEVLYSWKQVDFDFPNQFMREEMIRKQEFIPRNNLILDMDIYEEGPNRMIFVTLPRVRPGVPVTLATVSPRQSRGVNLLVPFPDWRSHRPGDCENGITSVFRTHVDLCGRLWVLDSGNNNAFQTGQSRIVCPPQVLIYDLKRNNELIGKYRIPGSMLANNSLLVTINVDTRSNDCRDDLAYIADAFGNKLLVFSLQDQQFWRTNSSLFYPYPGRTNFSVNGVDFTLSGGIFGLALSPLYRGDRRLYFHSICSVKQSFVDTADLRNPRPWLQSVDANPRVFRELGGERSSQSAAAAMDENGVMFFGLIGSNELACWNSATDFSFDNIVILSKDDTNFQFNSGIKVYRDKLYAVTNRLQNYLTNQIRENEDNYRILVGDTRQLIRGTKCDVRQFSGFGSDHYQGGDRNQGGDRYQGGDRNQGGDRYKGGDRYQGGNHHQGGDHYHDSNRYQDNDFRRPSYPHHSHNF